MLLSAVKSFLRRFVFDYDHAMALKQAREDGKLIERSKHRDSYDGIPRCPACDTMLRRVMAGGHAFYLCPFENFHTPERVTAPVPAAWSERDRVTGPIREIQPTGTAMQSWRKKHAASIDTKHINAIRRKNEVRLRHG